MDYSGPPPDHQSTVAVHGLTFALGKRLFHGPAFTALLRRCGIEARQYWILVDLFEALGKRQEVTGMSSDAYSMRTFTQKSDGKYESKLLMEDGTGNVLLDVRSIQTPVQ